jgi:hypothetical protein
MAPSPFGCVLSAVFCAKLPLIEIKGPSKKAMFERAALFLRALERQAERPLAITAPLESRTPAEWRRAIDEVSRFATEAESPIGQLLLRVI